VLSKTFTAQVVTEASPQRVFEFLADAEHQRQWRDAHSGKFALVMEAEPWSKVAFSDGVVVELYAEGAGTRMHAVRTQTAEDGAIGRLGLRFMSRRAEEERLRQDLMRIDAAVTYDDL
jgi:hypothetical protein